MNGEVATMLNRFRTLKALLILCLFLVAPSSSASAQGIDVVRNGDFSDGLDHWNINPKIDPMWSPLEGGGVNLHPPAGWEGFMGTVLYQNLNVNPVANITFDFSMDLHTASSHPTEGTTIRVELSYVKGPTGDERLGFLEIDMPANAEISHDPDEPTRVERQVTFPTDADRLVKLSVIKEGWGEFIADNISLIDPSNVVIARPVPQVTGVSATQGAYGSGLTISGTDFGDSPGLVSLGGSSAGVRIDSWSDTSIRTIIEDPARSGHLYVVSDFVESDIRHSFEVTSPNYTVGFIKEDLTVVKGQTAEYLIRVDFLNDFTTDQGISFSIDQDTLPPGASAAFTPAPLANEGGLLLKIDTEDVDPGDYFILLKAQEPGSRPRYAPFMLEVVTIREIRFFERVTNQDVTSVPLAKQGEFNPNSSLFDVEAVDSNGDTWTLFGPDGFGEGSPLSIQSSNPAVALVYATSYGAEYYALAEGEADLVATAADGTQKSLPVTVSIPEDDPQIASITISPAAVSYDYGGDLLFSATGSHALSVGTYVSGMADFRSGFHDNLNYADGNRSVTSSFQLGDDLGPLEPGIFTVLLRATASDEGSKSASSYAMLHITPSQDDAQLKGGVRKLDDIFAEGILLELYDEAGNIVHEREVFMHHRRDFHLAGIPAGTYKLKFTYWDDIEVSRWYPNTQDMDDAEPLTFIAGEVLEDVYFFLKDEDVPPEPVPMPSLDQALRALKIAAGKPGVDPGGIRDVNRDGKIGYSGDLAGAVPILEDLSVCTFNELCQGSS